MSKTRKTRPFWVKVMDNPTLYLRPSHQCSDFNEDCDLPEKPKLVFGMDRTRCYWIASENTFDDPELGCGCRLCTMHHERKEERRRNRREAREYVRNGWVDEY